MLNPSLLVFITLLVTCLSQSNSPGVTKLRLFDGNSSSNSGTLQMYNPNPGDEWITISPTEEYEEEQQAAILSVICRSLGYDADPSQIEANVVEDSYMSGTTIRFYGIRCTGSESDISSCLYDHVGVDNYIYSSYNITCPKCENNAMRLSGSLPYSGFVEVCLNGSWYRVCSNSWGYTNSFVVCHQLGYPATHATATFYTSATIGIPILINGYLPTNQTFACYGNESRLTDCITRQNSYCTRQYRSGFIDNVIVQCTGERPVNCTDGSVKLVGGDDMYEGVVHICINGLWSTMDASNWDHLDVTVVCRQLGLLQPSGRVTIPNIYNSPDATGPIHDSPRCNGTELSIQDCTFPTSYHYNSRSHYYDAAARCHATPNPVTQCINGSVRLVGGQSSNEGRVEVCLNGVWGSMCNSYGRTADVVCRQLGYLGSNNTIVFQYDRYQPYGQGTGPIHVSELSCSGYENKLFECQSYINEPGAHRCSSNQDIGVRCDTRPPMPCNDGELRLAAGHARNEGYPQICVDGEWLSFFFYSWGTGLNIFFCQAFTGRTDSVYSYASCCVRDSVRQSNVSISRVSCPNGHIMNLTQACEFTTAPSRDGFPVVLGCYTLEPCVEGSVRLYNGTSSSNGIVQVCRNNVWGSIASYEWNRLAAEVVCRQLGLPWEWAIGELTFVYDTTINDYKAPHFYRNVRCTGQEPSILNCSYNELTLEMTLPESYTPPARVYCQDSTSRGASPPCSSGDVRLGNSTNDRDRIEGRVEICTEGTWVTLCDGGESSRNESRTICRQLLGQHATVSYHTRGRNYSVSNFPMISGLTCNRDSVNISQCTINHQPTYSYSISCPPHSQVGVVCLRDTHYEVSVSAMQSPPYRVGLTINLTCEITPRPPSAVQVYYGWRLSNTDFNYNYIFTSDSPYFEVQIGAKQFGSVFYYCDVLINDYITSGFIDIRVEGLLMPASRSTRSTTDFGQSFRVSHSDNLLAITPLVYNLNWFFNGEQLANGSGVLIGPGNFSLMTSPQNGTYEARYTALRVLPYNRYCETNILRFLSGYAAYKPAQFVIGTTQDFEEAPIIELSSTGSSSRVINFQLNEKIVLHFSGEIPDCLDFDDVDVKLYHNGVRIQTLVNYTKSYQGGVYGLYVINNASSNDQGIYEAILSWRYAEKCRNYRSQILDRGLFFSFVNDFNEMIIAKSHIQAVYYETLNLMFSSSRSSISSGEVSIITCAASIGYPEFTTISIVKNGVTIAMSQRSPITLATNTVENPIGKYECFVQASGAKFRRELVIKERAVANLNLQLPNEVSCSEGDRFSVMIQDSVLIYLQNLCECNLEVADLQNFVVRCPSSSEAQIVFTLDYSSDDGVVSAADLTEFLSGQRSNPENSLTIAGATAHIPAVCDNINTGTMDIGTMETGTMDVNTRDAGTMEVNTRDAGTMDVNTMDAGTMGISTTDVSNRAGGTTTAGSANVNANAGVTTSKQGVVEESEALLPTTTLIGVFVAIFVGGALCSAIFTSIVVMLIMRSSTKKTDTKMIYSDLKGEDNIEENEITKIDFANDEVKE